MARQGPGKLEAGGKVNRHIKIGSWHVRVPAHPIVRIILGVLLVIGGMLGFLPILGFWMIPLGLILLSVDLRLVRRWRRRIEVWWGRRRRTRLRRT